MSGRKAELIARIEETVDHQAAETEAAQRGEEQVSLTRPIFPICQTPCPYISPDVFSHGTPMDAPGRTLTRFPHMPHPTCPIYYQRIFLSVLQGGERQRRSDAAVETASEGETR